MSDLHGIAYTHDRIPVIPPALFVGDRVLTIHTEGEPGEDVDWRITSRSPSASEPVPGGLVTVTYEDSDGARGETTFEDPAQWLSVAFPRIQTERSAA